LRRLVVARRLEQAVVAGRELERLVLALGLVVGLEADARLQGRSLDARAGRMGAGIRSVSPGLRYAIPPVEIRTSCAPAAASTCMVAKYRSAPVSKLYAMTPRLYQCSSALLPLAEYRTSATVASAPAG